MAIELRVYFEDLTLAQANQSAQEFEQDIKRLARAQVQTERRKAHKDTQDMGSIVALVLDSLDPEVIIVAVKWIAKAIRTFLMRTRNKIRIQLPDRTSITIESPDVYSVNITVTSRGADKTITSEEDFDNTLVNVLLESLPNRTTTGENSELEF